MIEEFLTACANAQDLTDVNIAAGTILQDHLDGQRRITVRRAKAALVVAAAAVVSCIAIGDTFAASPLQAGIVPWPQLHVFTRLGLPDWTVGGRARVFDVSLGKAHDGWLVDELGESR